MVRMGLFSKKPKPPAARALSGSWAQVTTLEPRRGTFYEASGSYFHRQEIEELVGTGSRVFLAQLVPEARGRYQGTARIYVGTKQVATIPDSMQPKAKELMQEMSPATLWVWVKGGEWVDVSILCDMEPRKDDSFTVPAWNTRCPDLTEEQINLADSLLNSKAKTKTLKLLGQLSVEDDRVFVDVAGMHLEVPDTPFSQIKGAADLGYEMTCAVNVDRRPDRPLRVRVFTP